MRKSVSIIAVAAALALGGCGHKAEKATDATVNGIDNVAGATGNVIANAADSVKEAVTPTPTVQEFVDKAAKSDAFEIASAKLAKDKAVSSDLKSFAAMMIEDHTASTAKIKKAAASAMPAITPDATLTDDQQGKLADLARLSGKDFDKAYADQQIDAHKAALSLMQVYSDKGDVPGLKTVAGDILPKVQAHLDKIRAIKDKL